MNGIPDEDFLAAVEKVSRLLGHFAIGITDRDDVHQQTALFAMELLEKGQYDPSRPFTAYLYVHAKRRWLNLHRETFLRDPPCHRCHQEGGCQDGRVCDAYRKWQVHADRKLNLAYSHEIDDDGVRRECVSGPLDEICGREVEESLLRELPEELVLDLHKHLTGRLAPARLKRLWRAVEEHLAGNDGGQV